MKQLKTILFSIIGTVIIVLVGLWFYVSNNATISTNNDINTETKIDPKKLPEIIPLNAKGLDKLINRSDSIILIKLWASWCAPCISEMNVIAALKKKYSNIKFILISSDIQNEDRILKSSEILLRNGIDFPTYIIEGGSLLDIKSNKKVLAFLKNVSNKFKTDPGYPYTIVLNNGTIIYEKVGTEDNEFESYLYYNNLFSRIINNQEKPTANNKSYK